MHTQLQMSKQPRSWVDVVSLHPDVTGKNFSEDLFALDLGPLADGDRNVPAVYRDPEHFFRVSYLTKGLKGLLNDVLSRLSGAPGNRVLKLVTPFGGGKSHTLASLFHAATNRKALDVSTEGRNLARPKDVRVAAFDGQFFDAVKGKSIGEKNFRALTVWGWIAWSLGGKSGYEMLRKQDEIRVAPGGDEILALLKTGPNLILLDEVLTYLIRAGGVKVLETNLKEQTLLFLQSLTVAVSNSPHSVLVFSMQSSKPTEALDYNSLFHTVDHLAARKDQLREPVEGSEVLSVIQRRLLARPPTPEEATPVATEFQEKIAQMKRAYATSKTEEDEAEQEGILLRDRVRAAYPFHPALIDLMRERWAAIPEFQRTRGALRFLAACLRVAKRERSGKAVLGPGDVPIYDPEVRLAFFKEVGQQADFQAVLEKDFIGPNATAKKIDERRARENSGESSKWYASRLATAILMYSFGGLKREGASGTEILPPGIGELELLSVCVGPDMDSTTAQACLKALREKCLYLHFDGVNYCFKKDPNVTLLVDQEVEAISRNEQEINQRIREMLEERIGGAQNAIVWPEKPGDIDDHLPTFLLAYAPFDFSTKPQAEKERVAKQIFERFGDKPRQYKNGIALAVPTAEQVEILRRSVRLLLAIERVRQNAKKLNLTDDQKSQLEEKYSSERSSAELAFLRLYTEIWVPNLNGEVNIERVAIGGRQLAAKHDEQKRALVHKRAIELLHDTRRLFPSVLPSKICELFQLGEGKAGIKISEIVDGFFSFLGFTRLEDATVIKRAVMKGVADGVFGIHIGTPPVLGTDGKYQVATSRVRINSTILEDEVDLDSGFLILPQAIPTPESPVSTTGPDAAGAHAQPAGLSFPGGTQIGGDTTAGYTVPPQTASGLQTSIEFEFSANQNQLYQAWSALANLADMAGKVNVRVRAESEKGFDKSKLQNGVLEPLREADLIE